MLKNTWVGKVRGMSDESEYEFFKLRKQSRTYISKVFTFDGLNTEPFVT